MNEITTTLDLDAPRTSTALTVVQRSEVSTIIAADESDILGNLARELHGYEVDATTEKGRKEASSKAYKVSVAKQNLIRLAGTLKEDAQKRIKGVNAEVRVIEDRMDGLRDQILAPVEAYKKIEEDRVAGHQKELAAIPEAEGYGFVETPAELQLRLHYLQNYPARNWHEFTTKAEATLAAEIARTERLLADAERREAEAAELARLQAEAAERAHQEAARLQAEREARIAEEAAQRARQEAEARAERERLETLRVVAERQAAAERQRLAEIEAAEQERRRLAAEAIEAADRAEAERRRIEKERQDAEERAARAQRDLEAAETNARIRAEAAARKAEADRAEAARQADRDRQAAVTAEQKRVADERAAEQAEAEKRAADVAHRGRINRAAMKMLASIEVSQDGVDQKMTPEMARVVVSWIAMGKIPHVSITY